MITIDEYKAAVIRTWNPKLIGTDNIHNAIYGLAGETGETIDELKKWLFHGIPFDRAKIVKELGDIHYYLTALEILLDLSPEEIMETNKLKLEGRYPEGFTEGGGNREERRDK